MRGDALIPRGEYEVELGRRVRMARGYAHFSQGALAERTGFSLNTLRRIEDGTRDVAERELRTIAEATEFPIGLLRDGWDALITARQAEAMLADLEKLDRDLADLVAMFRRADRKRRERDS